MHNPRRYFRLLALCGLAIMFSACLAGCSVLQGDTAKQGGGDAQKLSIEDKPAPNATAAPESSDAKESASPQAQEKDDADKATLDADEESARAQLNLIEDYRDSFIHGQKTADYQKYIVLHDTESDGDGASVVDYWDGNGAGVAAHFVVGKDGSVIQCVALDTIAHHAGFGDTGHNDAYGVVEDGRDDLVGTVPIGDWASDYGMNAWSIGIEMVHVGGSGDYPEAQLEAVDKVIAYINAHYGFESSIIDHKEWRSGNSDTSAEFAGYLANYKDHGSYK